MVELGNICYGSFTCVLGTPGWWKGRAARYRCPLHHPCPPRRVAVARARWRLRLRHWQWRDPPAQHY